MDTIFDKYREFINQSKSGYVKGLGYESAMEILRYCEKVLNKKMSMTFSCGICLFNLVKTFAKLEK
jgi:hypothetical protein